jgi:hypothetical protein
MMGEAPMECPSSWIPGINAVFCAYYPAAVSTHDKVWRRSWVREDLTDHGKKVLLQVVKRQL